MALAATVATTTEQGTVRSRDHEWRRRRRPTDCRHRWGAASRAGRSAREPPAVDVPTAAHDSMVKARAPAARATAAETCIRVRQLLVVHNIRRVLILVAVITAVIIIPRLRRKANSGHHVAGAADVANAVELLIAISAAPQRYSLSNYASN